MRRLMIVFVRYNLGPGVAVELQEGASVAELKKVVGSQQGVPPEQLRVLFAGRELQSTSSLQSCDLPEQSTVHVVPPPSRSSSSQLLLFQEPQGSEEEQESLTRLDLSSSRLPATPADLTGTLKDGEMGDGGQRLQEEGELIPGTSVRSRSSFFVYCKTCRSIQPGKLRVRCRTCKQTALTLSRGPSCWDDVLIPGRIHGNCQSEGCCGNEGEFYMKCASHPTSDDDVSVALDLVMINNKNVPCIACTDIMGVVLVFQCSERHVICLDCFRLYCQSRLNERQFVHHAAIGYSLPCAAGCEDSLIKELHHFRVLGDDQYARYQQYATEECLLKMGGLMCPAPGCGAGLLPSDPCRRVECERQLGCGFVFCRECREAYHQGECRACQAPPMGDVEQGFVVDEEASRRGRWEQASQRLIQEMTKPCPNCSVPVERNGGCMHMHCALCQADWCWLCGVPWNRECMGNHWFG
ncbi:E3 ubiquitin-protein ligase parkin [Oryzias latipes]|uniref:E3 ubiquitin-protein ligase parkin n=1 Tax=Oryzias latipes TaxID=8090 RepID=A0A3B3IP36_ORYLA|nr:E3 ubiquitin-protein ligase parkin [Oryzias latipes]